MNCLLFLNKINQKAGTSNAMKKSINYSTLVGLNDLPLARKLIPHQLEQLSLAGAASIRIVVDDLKTDYQIYLSSLEFLFEQFPQAQIRGLREFHSNYRSSKNKYIVGNKVPERDFRGVPYCGWLAGLEPFNADLHFHSDCDILYGGEEITRWLEHAGQKLDQDVEIFCISPHPGPLGSLRAQSENPLERNGCYLFGKFSSRRFLISKDKEDAMKARPSLVPSRKTIIKNCLKLKSSYENWEMTMSGAISRRGLYRAHSHDCKAWSIHIDKDKGLALEHIDYILSKVEDGDVPELQFGEYDLVVAGWI